MNVDTRVVTDELTANKYKMIWRNLGNVPLDDPRFVKRADRLKEHMKEINADIICFSECRDSEAIDNYESLPINKFLADIAQFRYEIYNQKGTTTPNDPKKAFYLSILIDKTKFYVEQSKMIPISDNLFYPLTVNLNDFSKSSFNRSLHAIKLYPMTNNKIHYLQPFWILTTHLNIPQQDNFNQSNWINNNIESITGGKPYILTGDFNYFPDNCSEQELIMSEKHIDCFKGNAVEYATNRRMDSTFVGFINDNFKNNNIYDLNNSNILDRVFINKNYNLHVTNQIIDTRLFLHKNEKYYEEENKLNRYDFPSDHFPLVFNIGFE